MSSRRTTRRTQPSTDELTIRWFTPKGREAVAELLDDLRHGEGEHVAEIVADLRRAGAPVGALDLRGIDLRGEDLGSARLARADLSHARLDRASLRNADLSGARLSSANLRGANLRGASLRSAVLDHANLTDVDLSEADLELASLSEACLLRTRLRRTWAKGVDFAAAGTCKADLSQVRRQVYKPKARPRHRAGVGAPPGSEPRRPTERHAAHTPRGTRAFAPRPTGRGVLTQGFEEALAELLLNKGSVDRISVSMGGREVVLYQAPLLQRRAA